jgi:hypothetical protein
MPGGEEGSRRVENHVIDRTDPLPGRSLVTMLPSERRLVQQVIDRLTLIEQWGGDSLDMAELYLELEGEFGEEAVRWGVRFYEALKVAEGRRMADADRGPLWDRDLDGGDDASNLLE